MVSLTCTASQEQGITLVTGRIENPDRPRRVRVENRLDGPVWPPRRRGVPAAGWSDACFECVLAAGETRALGYASPAPPADPPLAVVEAEPVDPESVDDTFEPKSAVPSVDETPNGVVRELGSPRPPRDAVPVPDAEEELSTTDSEANADGTSEAAEDTVPETAGEPSGTTRGTPSELSEDPSADSGAGTTDRGDDVETRLTDSGPEAVEDWFAAVEARLDLADALSGTTRLSAVADALARAGGLDGVRDTADRLDADAEDLRRVAERASALADRAETATVPVEPIERLQ
ncbi:DUF7857 domain-containing protein [Halorientalis salina]|uniref:DUF7857 domain-containing protein n=1 Tax=Halorientalis salina TaxID=2932266 RepID=UPI0010ACD77D|nr:hypothetical protein [Halorientalis salina]